MGSVCRAVQQRIELTSGVAAAAGQFTGGIGGAEAAGLQLLQLGAQSIGIPSFGFAGRRPAQHHRAFALGFACAEVLQRCRQGGAHVLFMALGELAGHLHGPLSSAVLDQFFEQLQQAVRRFIENAGALLLGDGR